MWYYNHIFRDKRKNEPKEHYQPYKHDAKKADQNIKYCESCDRCWEVDEARANGSYYRSRGIRPIVFYEDFPLLGKEKEQCEECK